MAGKGDGFVAHAFHQAAVARQAIGVVADDAVAMAGIEQPLGKGHTDGIADPLPQRTGRGFNAGRMAIFRVSGGLRAELAEMLQLLDIHLRIAGEIEQ